MQAPPTEIAIPTRSQVWKWWVCGLLLLATMLNYMDRLTLNLTAKLVMGAFDLDAQDYGQLESVFAVAFAIGSITFGWLADRINIRWLYPLALLAWSASGFATGLVESFTQLLLCRFVLGFFEGSNWPCALRTTQRILPPEQRPMGNSILQSGTAMGAIVIPQLIKRLVYDNDVSSWRNVFLVVGGLGVTWVVLWMPSIREDDLALPPPKPGPTLLSVLTWIIALFGIDFLVHLPQVTGGAPWVATLSKTAVTIAGVAVVFRWLERATADDKELPRAVFFRRYWVLVVLVVSINITWHFLRAWLPLFLQNEHGYSLEGSSDFFTGYYIAADLGSLAAGAATLVLARSGWTIFNSRLTVYAAFAFMALASVAVPFLESGALLVVVLLIVGCGALGIFPVYYAFSQELTTQHQGKVTGCLGCTTWLTMALLHELVGDMVKARQSYAEGLALAGLAPLVGLAAVLLFWRPNERTTAQRTLTR